MTPVPADPTPAPDDPRVKAAAHGLTDADLLAAEDYATGLGRRFSTPGTPPGPCGLSFAGINCNCAGSSPSHFPVSRDPRALMGLLLDEVHRLRAAADAAAPGPTPAPDDPRLGPAAYALLAGLRYHQAGLSPDVARNLMADALAAADAAAPGPTPAGTDEPVRWLAVSTKGADLPFRFRDEAEAYVAVHGGHVDPLYRHPAALADRAAVEQAIGGAVHVASEAAAAVDAVMAARSPGWVELIHDHVGEDDEGTHDGPAVTEPPC